MADEATTDYARIGGGDAVRQVVGRFYEMVLADPELAGYFTGVDLPKLKRHQALLISQVLGGPAEYDGRDLKAAHRGMAISKDHFGRVVVHLVAALREAGVPEDVIGRVGQALGGTEADIVEG
ncbi:group I truncated hemoglobin [Actinocatenispora rupis]|uniref:Group 1 truncated hemoglobin n=1 Tax=Actinocatenispora rupis TaxID=519421 RepID=A0A8J3J2W6_9ACTN|nr:group 1 truncated hemoglobin [Actinocatenispora rupis]GID10591.1 hemin transporter [Actinocatenispora rupis]